MRTLAILLITHLTLCSVSAQSLCISKGDTPNSIAFHPDQVNDLLHPGHYKAFFFGEQHNAGFDPEIKYHLIKDLHSRYGVRHVFMEIGTAAAWCFNRYLQTGDTAYLYNPRLVYTTGHYALFWQRLFSYNRLQPDSLKIVIHGVDFERTEVFRVLKKLAPATQPLPPALKPVMDTIEAHLHDKPLTMYAVTDRITDFTDNSSFTATLKYIRQQLMMNNTDTRTYFGNNYPLVHSIITNEGRPIVRSKPRNKTMLRKMKEAMQTEQVYKFIGFFGKAHTDYTITSALPNALARTGRFKHADMLNIASLGYNMKASDGTLIEFKESRKAAALNGNCKATLLPAAQVPGYKRSADFVIVFDNDK